MNRLKNLVVGFFVMGSTIAAASPRQVQVKTLTELSKSEPWSDAIALLDNKLWVGRSDESGYRLEIFDTATHKTISSETLPHSVRYLREHDGQMFAVGGKPTDTSIDMLVSKMNVDQRGRVVRSSNRIPAPYVVQQFAGSGNNLFFSSQGDARMLRYSGGQIKLLPPEIHAPYYVTKADNFLFVTELNNITQPMDDNLVRIDLTSNQAERTFTDFYRGRLGEVIYAPEINRVILAEGIPGRVLFINPETNLVTDKIDLPHPNTKSLTTFGRCIVAASADSKVLTFIDGNSKGIVDEWDISNVPDFGQVSSMVGDPANDTVFVRSAFVCSSCPVSQSRVIAVTDPTAKIKDACALR